MTERAKQSRVTPTLAQVLKNAIDARLLETRVSMPARIVTYDFKTQKADVQPVLKRKFIDGEVLEMPVIHNVAVAHPRAGKAFIHLPLKKDDFVMLIFADRSLDKWLSSGGVVDPEDLRMHHPSDAMAYPGLYPFNDPATVANGDDIIIKNRADGSFLEIRVKNNNHIQVKNSTQELVLVLNDMLQIIREAVVYTSTGRQQLRHSLFAKVASRLKTFLEN